MINALIMVNKLPGLTMTHFLKHWLEQQGPLAAKLPGLRRYTQNHAHRPAYARADMTHDGWSELWFDNYAAFESAVKSPEWATMEADAATVFAPTKGVVIGTEYVQKDANYQRRDYGVLGMTLDEIKQRLIAEGYDSLAADPSAPAKIKQARKLKRWRSGHRGISLRWTHASTRGRSVRDRRRRTCTRQASERARTAAVRSIRG